NRAIDVALRLAHDEVVKDERGDASVVPRREDAGEVTFEARRTSERVETVPEPEVRPRRRSLGGEAGRRNHNGLTYAEAGEDHDRDEQFEDVHDVPFRQPRTPERTRKNPPSISRRVSMPVASLFRNTRNRIPLFWGRKAPRPTCQVATPAY